MPTEKIFLYLAVVYLTIFAHAHAAGIASSSGDREVIVREDGSYELSVRAFAWQLTGKLPSGASSLVATAEKDSVGSYHQLAFDFSDESTPIQGRIRIYDDRDLFWFSQTLMSARTQPPAPFPNFTTFPQNLFQFSYSDTQFSPPSFELKKNAGPWLLFDQQYHALIFSPSSHFPSAFMVGDGKTQLACGFHPKLQNLPSGFTQTSMLVVTQGINHAFDLWGQALIDSEGKKRIPNDADVLLKYLGYWTDNGGAYWYHYDLEKGYQQTLLDLMDSYHQKQISFGYLQLDSWWYHKTLTRYDGVTEAPMNKALPEGDWNRYGGTTDYEAHPFVFPQGLAAFHQKVGLPFVTHNRWIDPTSPYHQRYKISGIAAVDPGFWNEIATYLQTSGVIGYEQDWLVDIFKYSPELSSTVDQGEAFLDSMAEAAQTHGLSLQYCMATPRCFLQGSKYANLTSIRVSDDGFIPERYHNFFYVSKLASSLGIWPFTDVFRSPMTSSALLSTLSAGPVGSGDARDREDQINLRKIIRADGVIIKPDVPLVAMDRTYLAEAQKDDLPMLASTYTDHEGRKTFYLISYKNSPAAPNRVSVTAEELGCTGPFYFFDCLSSNGLKIEAGGTCLVATPDRDFAFYMAAPIGPSGIAFLGDADCFVGTGKKRISALRDDGTNLSATVIFADQEKSIRLRGYDAQCPKVSVEGGKASRPLYDSQTGLFNVTIEVDPLVAATTVDGDPIRKVRVTFGH